MTNRFVFRRFAPALLIVLSAFIFEAAGQDATGRIVGVVTDPSGSVVANARVTATNVATQNATSTTTGRDGSYQIQSLNVGEYRVSTDVTGFRRTVTEPVKLEINQALKIDLKLEVGAVTETVSVEAATTGVETISATTGSVVNATTIHEAPLNGRNVMSLALLVPGVIPGVAGNNTAAGGAGFSIAGQRTDFHDVPVRWRPEQ